jgi:hypothetical protein
MGDLHNAVRLKYVDKQVVIDMAKQMTDDDILGYLEDHGDPEYYGLARHEGYQRKGQAFMNALDTVWYELISGTPEDPFATDDAYSVYLAIAWLTAQEIANEK